MKPDKPVDEQTGTQRARQPILDGRKIGIDTRTTRRYHARVQDQADNRQEHVDVEEGRDLLPAHGGEFASHVQDHDDGHAEGKDVHRVGGPLEDDGVGEFDGAGIAARQDAGGGAGRDVRAGADKRTQRDRRLSAYRGEVAERHCQVLENQGRRRRRRRRRSKEVGGRLYWGGGNLLLCAVH